MPTTPTTAGPQTFGGLYRMITSMSESLVNKRATPQEAMAFAANMKVLNDLINTEARIHALRERDNPGARALLRLGAEPIGLGEDAPHGEGGGSVLRSVCVIGASPSEQRDLQRDLGKRVKLVFADATTPSKTVWAARNCSAVIVLGEQASSIEPALQSADVPYRVVRDARAVAQCSAVSTLGVPVLET